MTATVPSPETVDTALRRLRKNLSHAMDTRAPARLRKLWSTEWHKAMVNILSESKQRPEVVIALVGGTGQGKSTLINAVLDAHVLPVGNVRACTAAISEVSFAEGPHYEVTIDFVSRESWQKEIALLIQDVADSDLDVGPEDDHGSIELMEMSRAARDKIQAVYKMPESVPSSRLSLHELIEPTEVAEALDCGTRKLTLPTTQDLKTTLRVYLSSEHRFWPIVKKVSIRGPFEALRGGGKLVDLPGLNDSNEAREQVTHDYLKTSRFVWIVFNIKRVLTKDIKNLMQSDAFVREVVMDGREGALSFIATASDAIDMDSAPEEFQLPDDCLESEAVLARNEVARREIKNQLAELAMRVARNAGDESRAGILTKAFCNSAVFTVSARDYLHVSGLSKNKSKTLDTPEQTEIPQLRNHLATLSAKFGVEAQAKAHHRRIHNLLIDIAKHVIQEKAAIERQEALSAQKRKELKEAIDRLASFLGHGLQDYCERFAQDLDAAKDLLGERLKRATDKARSELDQVTRGWNRIHWATLRAIVRRDGAFHSASSGVHDLPADIAKPILNGITFAWVDFFGDKLDQIMDKWTGRLLLAAEKHGHDILLAIQKVNPDAASPMHEDHKRVAQATERLIAEHVGQAHEMMLRRIETVRRNLYERIPEQIAADMRSAFENAARESGAGMKARMVGTISKHAVQVSGDMFHDVEEAVGEGVRSLNDWLKSQFKEMANVVERQSQVQLENATGTDNLSPEDLGVQRDDLEALEESIKQIQADPEIVPVAA